MKRLQGKISFNYSVLKISGSDRLNFLQGQTTNNIKTLKEGQYQLDARLTRNGRLLGFGIILKCNAELYWLFEAENLAKTVKEDLERFIIMDDVTINWISKEVYFYFHPYQLPSSYCGLWLGMPCQISFENHDIPPIDVNDYHEALIVSGTPRWTIDIQPGQLMNDTFLNEVAIDYQKGCFLGQETVSKIHHRRGAGHYSFLLKFDRLIDVVCGDSIYSHGKKIASINYSFEYEKFFYIHCQLSRQFQVHGRKLEIEYKGEKYHAIANKIPLIPWICKEDLSKEFYYRGIELFQQDLEEKAEHFLQLAIAYDPSQADAYEALGAIYGRQEKYHLAIDLMEQLQHVDSHSVMAHTNKSLYYMKLGKIEEAEAEKSLATVKSFKAHGQAAKIKREAEETRKGHDLEIQRRRGMFQQVLELDPLDAMANYGLGELFVEERLAEKAIPLLTQAIESDKKYSVAYLALGKAYELLDNISMAIKIYEKGIEIASSNGDLMPANSMQERINDLEGLNGWEGGTRTHDQ